MVQHFDHVTVVVKDLSAAERFFTLLGFVEDTAVVISGPRLSRYMRMEDMVADHVTLVLPGSSPRLEVQLLRSQHPESRPDPTIDRLDKIGFNHICFAVEDIQQELVRLKAQGVKQLNEVMDFHSRKLVFLEGPEGITIEPAQRS